MADIAELKKRKVPLNLAIVHVDPDAFIANFMGWLEITAFITAQQAGEAPAPASAEIPTLSPQQLRKGGVHDVGNDAIFAFCMTAAMKAGKSNFVHEIMYPLANWTRGRWTETLEKGVAFLQHIEDNVPVLRAVLDDPRNDQPFIANALLNLAPAVDMELTEAYQGFLRSLARRS